MGVGSCARAPAPPVPDTGRTKVDVSTTEKPTNKEHATAVETKHTSHMYKLPDLRSRIRNRIYITKVLLTNMTSPIQNLTPRTRVREKQQEEL